MNKKIKRATLPIIIFIVGFLLSFLTSNYVVEIVRVSTSSMKPSIQSKYVLVNKLKPGIRIFTNNSNKYYRLKVGGKINRKDIVYFNLPQYDTLDFQNKITENQKSIRRVIGLPGEKVKIKNGDILINNTPFIEDFPTIKSYKWKGDTTLLNRIVNNHKEIEIIKQDKNHILNIPNFIISKLEPYKNNLTNDVISTKIYDNNIFPFSPHRRWNAYNMGTILIPKKGMTIKLNPENFDLYKKVIQDYEKENIELKGNYLFRNNIPISKYTFKMNYYWVQGDNQPHSFDSRQWGFLPENHIVGIVK